jgi:magnesium-transporting ATPase (P-type)
MVFTLGYYIYFNKLNFVYSFLFVAVAGSLISISLLIHFNQSLEQESLKTTALEIDRPNDNLLRFMLTETLSNSSKKDNVIEALMRKNSNYSALAFKIWSESSFQKESINSCVSILDRNQKELASFRVGDIISDENYSYGISNLTSGTPLIFEKNIEEQNLNIISGIIPVISEAQIIGFITAFIEIDNKSIGPLNVPDFLESQKNTVNTVIDPNQLLVFRFEDTKLINVIGDVYPSRDQLTPIMDAKFSNENESWVKLKINGEDYITYLLKDNSGTDKIIAVLLKVKDISWNLFNFFKIFILHSIFILLTLCVIIFYRIKNIRYSFRIQLLIAFLLISLIPIILLAIYNRQVVSRRSEEAIASELHEKIDYRKRY